MYQMLKRDGIRCSFDSQKIIERYFTIAHDIHHLTMTDEILGFLFDLLSDEEYTCITEYIESISDPNVVVTEKRIKRLCRKLLRKLSKIISVLRKALWRDRISTASRSNANSTDMMLFTIPTPPTDDYTEDVSCQWGGGTIVLPVCFY